MLAQFLEASWETKWNRATVNVSTATCAYPAKTSRNGGMKTGPVTPLFLPHRAL